MNHQPIARRTFVTGAAALAATGTFAMQESRALEPVPNSTGTEPPKLKALPNATDCHMHIYDGARFAPARPDSRMQANATVSDYRLLQKRIGTSRVVVVSPAAYGTDNRVTIDALTQLGASARGVVVVHPTVGDAELKGYADAGVRGIRFTQGDPRTATTTMDMIEPLAQRMNNFGWHIQVHMRADQIAAAADLWRRIPCPMVFDHMGRLAPDAGIDDPAFGLIRALIDKGRTWVKISGAYLNTRIGPPSYVDASKVAQAYVKATPERMVWGSDWPHPTETLKEKPNDAILFDLLADWAPDEATRRKILVENPQTLYGFGA
jgi:predicted TIM-barrel fold metal-dependent hydrolase